MAYIPRKTWVDNTNPAGQPPSAGATPILASDLAYLETGIDQAHDLAVAAQADADAAASALAALDGRLDLLEAAPGGASVTLVDNGDGTFTASSSDSAVTDNGDGTFTIAA